MPIYTFACSHCAALIDAWRAIDDRDRSPTGQCPRCGYSSVVFERQIVAPAVQVFAGYRAVAAEKDGGERPMIRTRAEHEAFLRRNDYVEVGNDKRMAPLSNEELKHRARERAKEAATAAPTFNEADLIREGWIAEDL